MSSPKKYLIRDLDKEGICVWLQGKIEHTIQNDILIVSDGTGKAKITKCETADGIINKNSIKKGAYCCIIGKVNKTKGLPEIQAIKIVDLSENINMKQAWETEVRDLNSYLQGKTNPLIL